MTALDPRPATPAQPTATPALAPQATVDPSATRTSIPAEPDRRLRQERT